MNEIAILIVDDQQDLLDLFVLVFKRHPYKVYVAKTSGQVYETLAKENISIVLLDIMLGVDDGREICKNIKNNPATNHIKVMLMSAYDVVLNNWKQYAADGCLHKPFDIATLFEKTNALLN